MKLCKYLIFILSVIASGSGHVRRPYHVRRTVRPASIFGTLGKMLGVDLIMHRVSRGFRTTFLDPLPRPRKRFPVFLPQSPNLNLRQPDHVQFNPQNFAEIQRRPDSWYTNQPQNPIRVIEPPVLVTTPSYSTSSTQGPYIENIDSYGSPLAPPISAPYQTTQAPPTYSTTTSNVPVYYIPTSSTAASFEEPKKQEYFKSYDLPPKHYHPVKEIVPQYSRPPIPIPPRTYFPSNNYLTATMYRKVHSPLDLDLGASDTLLVVEHFPPEENDGADILLGSRSKTFNMTDSDSTVESATARIRFQDDDREMTTDKFINFEPTITTEAALETTETTTSTIKEEVTSTTTSNPVTTTFESQTELAETTTE